MSANDIAKAITGASTVTQAWGALVAYGYHVRMTNGQLVIEYGQYYVDYRIETDALSGNAFERWRILDDRGTHVRSARVR